MSHNDTDNCYRCTECGRHYHNLQGADFCERNDRGLQPIPKNLTYSEALANTLARGKTPKES